MKHATLLTALVAGLLAVVPAATAGGGHGPPGTAGAVFVQTNELSGNRIVVFDRAHDGQLTQAGTYATGGNGGAASPGTESDRLASQGSLVYDGKHKLLLAVNAGSDSVSTFSVDRDVLTLTDVVSSGGQFPASIAVQDKLVYVLNAGGAGTVQGFRIEGGGLTPIAGSTRLLGLANTNPPNFLSSPGQVGFTPNGRKLIVTTKASGSTIEVFDVGQDGLLSAAPVVNPSATPVPFAFTFGAGGRLVAGEAGTSSVTTYRIEHDGTLTGAQSQSDGQAALCWIERVGPFYFVANTGSDTLSGFRIGGDGLPSLVTPTGVVATTEPGPIDLASSGGRFLYGETGTTGTVDEYRVEHDGTLTKLGVVTGLPPGLEGIAST
jgi:hypothetical protein